MTKRGRVRVETDRESSRTYDVGRNEEVTVRTRHERPEVTGGGGGGGSDVGGALGCLGILIIFMVPVILAIGFFVAQAVDGTINAVEVNIVKRFNPNYKTRFEVVEEAEKERKEKKEEERKLRIMESEIYIESIEEHIKNMVATFINVKKVEYILEKKGYTFYVGSNGAFYTLDSNRLVWVCGELLCGANKKYYCPAIVFSEDSGNDYRVLKIFEELGRIISGSDDCYKMNISFSEELFADDGFLSIYSPNGGNVVYKTSDRGHSWDAVLVTKNIPIDSIGYIRRIGISDKNILLIILLQKNGCLESIESNDLGKSWIYKRDDKGMAKTFNGGLTWEAIEGKE